VERRERHQPSIVHSQGLYSRVYDVTCSLIYAERQYDDDDNDDDLSIFKHYYGHMLQLVCLCVTA